MKNIFLKGCSTLLLFCCLLPAIAQSPDDGFKMSKGELCLVTGYKESKWKHYWEGSRYRENKNLGTFSSGTFMPMLGFGITGKLNLFASLPYVSTSSNAGTMTGKKGWQDFSLAAKYQLLEIKHKDLQYFVFGTGGFSLPATRYVADYLPFSIGSGSKTASLRLIGHTVFKKVLFASLQAGYTFRGNITVDRITYYTDGQHYSNEMKVPDMMDASVKIGFDKKGIRTTAWYMIGNSTGGSDIRQNDMPYPGNKMDMQAAGITVLWWVPNIKGLGLNAGADKTLAGRNVGRAFNWMAGVQFVFKPFQKKPTGEATN